MTTPHKIIVIKTCKVRTEWPVAATVTSRRKSENLKFIQLLVVLVWY